MMFSTHPAGRIPWLAAVALAGCTSTPSPLPDGGLPELAIESAGPAIVLPGTWLRIYGRGFVDENSGSLLLELEKAGEAPWIRKPERLSDGELRLRIDDAFFAQLGGPGEFNGVLRVRCEYGAGLRQQAEIGLRLDLRQSLTPRVDVFSAGGGLVYLGSDIEATGSGFLLAGEGQTELRLTGIFYPDAGGQRAVADSPLVLEAVQRERLQGPLSAEALGIQPGRFEGSLVPVNVLQDKSEVPGNTVQASFEIGPTALLRLEPGAASRGQYIHFYGRGFVAGGARTTIRVEGTFTRTSGQVTDLTGANALEIAPQVVSGDHMRYVLRVQSDGQGGVQGLGAVPGVLRGTATPRVTLGSEVQVGIPLPGEARFEVLPQKQMVYISYLPGFTDALRLFGLRNMESAIRTRILEVVRRDYADYSVEFVVQRPSDFAEYSVIEVGGEDPNHQGLMGLDATMGKDIGNIYFDDIVGGNNADSRESGHYAFGGVFVDSFLAFSPHADKPMSIASPRFDDIFGPFAPFLGGEAVESGEYPGGRRAAAIELAVHALGSMIGNTISHEIGHTLGLAAGPPDFFHSLPGPNQLMDGGSDRPFEERAEIDGQGPAVFCPDDREYLLRILPK